MEVTSTVKPSMQKGKPIKGARLIVINSLGNIIANVLTNSEGKAAVSITVPKDLRFRKKNMGEVTVIAVANGYNEHINFSVPINEFDDKAARVSIPLWDIDPERRNEPIFINGSYHRFTVFEMLDYYAEKTGLVRQDIKDKSIVPPPWSSNIKQ
ncbi:carboxypeptidase-like regulatory domain-containing protein [Bacillus sp. MUM 116]|uniref:carboxypeptidase-like regulatory domain-containing protein n=1 Tax=Bacillus sp. MUM 116 TaxID=1678002 RepID=UPI00114D4745|nr:carboxypeptidase-like regulatory domain-containing protein [Bacillus sp. MUM 116]